MTADGDTRSEILDAAYAVLVDRGFDGFTTQAVADEAGRNQSLVHYYFDTKRDLVLAMFEEGLADLEDRIDELSADGDPIGRLRSLAEHVVEAGDEEHLAFKRALLELNARAVHDDDLREVVAHNHEYLREYVAEVVREGVDRGEFRDVDVEAFAATYVAAITGADAHAAVLGDEADDDRVAAGLRDVVTGYLRRADE